MPYHPRVLHYDVLDYGEALHVMDEIERNDEWAIVEYMMKADFRYRVWAEGRSLGGAHTMEEARGMIQEAIDARR